MAVTFKDLKAHFTPPYPAWEDVDTDIKEAVGSILFQFMSKAKKQVDQCPRFLHKHGGHLMSTAMAARSALYELGLLEDDPQENTSLSSLPKKATYIQTGIPLTEEDHMAHWALEGCILFWEEYTPVTKEFVYTRLLLGAQKVASYGITSQSLGLVEATKRWALVVEAIHVAANELGWERPD